MLGLLYQTSISRATNKSKLTAKQKEALPIEEKESYRWLEHMDVNSKYISNHIKILHIADREGDMYELFDHAYKNNHSFLIRIAQNRKTTDCTKIMDDIAKMKPQGFVETIIPRDSRRKIKKRQAILDISYKKYQVMKPEARRKDKHLADSVTITIIHVKERQTDDSIEPIEWFLATSEPINSVEEAYTYVGYYIQRWKIERFHYVLKSGCNIEKKQERTVEKKLVLIFIYSMLSAWIMNVTFLGRLDPELSCEYIFDEIEWELLYLAANKKASGKFKKQDNGKSPYTIGEAIEYLGVLGRGVRSPSDVALGLKAIWKGLLELESAKFYVDLLDSNNT